MKTSREIIKESVAKVQGEKLPIGSVAAHPDDPIARKLITYEDDGTTAVLSWDGVTKRWPASEVFNPNRAYQVAVRLKVEDNLKFAENASAN